MLQFDLKITRALTSCPDNGPPVFSVKVEAQERYVAGERFEVDYQAMSSPFKTTGFDISYHESGTIRTINARAQDQTGTVLVNVARTGLAIAGAVTGNFAVSAIAAAPLSGPSAPWTAQMLNDVDAGSVSIQLRCTAAARELLQSLDAATEEVKGLAAEAATLAPKITSLASLAALRVISQADRDELAQAVRRSWEVDRLLRAAVARMAAIQGQLGATQQLSWPDQAGDISSHSLALAPDEASLEKLSGLVEGQMTGTARPITVSLQALGNLTVRCEDGRDKSVAQCLREQLLSRTTLNIALAPIVTQSPAPPGESNNALNDAIIPHDDRRWARGIFVREPIEARLVVCRAPATVLGTDCSARDTTAFRGDPLIAPQVGACGSCFRSRAFENNRLQLSVRANGCIEQFSYGEDSSAAAASGALADVAERTQASLEAMETERRADIQYARDSRTYQRNEAIAARTEIVAARTEELAQLTHQLNMLKTQQDLLTVQINAQLASPNRDAVAQAMADKARIDAEVQLLQSQISRLRAVSDLATLSAPAS